MGYKRLRVILMAIAMLLLSGCFFRNPDDLYKLPERSAGYEVLEARIKEVCDKLEQDYGTSSEYAVIFSGENTSTIQLQDMDGDGELDTAVTFRRVPGAEKAIKICFFAKEGADSYRFSGMVEGEGSAVYRIDYVDLNGSGSKEVVVSWQLGSGIYQLGVYTMDDKYVSALYPDASIGLFDEDPLQPELFDVDDSAEDMPEKKEVLGTELLLTSYSKYALLDIDQDTRTEIAVARIDQAGDKNWVEVYGWQDGALISDGTVNLSHGISAVDDFRSNYVQDELLVPALYISSTLSDGGKATDIIAYRNNELSNLTMDTESGVSRQVIYNYTQVGLNDINGDYILEMPSPIALPTSTESGVTDFWLLNWGQYDLTGERTQTATTYHNISDGWYLDIPDSWKEKLIISRSDRTVGQRAVIFSLWNGPDVEPTRFLVIYKLTGPNRFAWASTTSRFTLQEDDDTIYAATFYTADYDCGLTDTTLRERFRLMSTSWSVE